MKYLLIGVVVAAVVAAAVVLVMVLKKNVTGGYKQISQDEAMEMMKRDDGHVIVDVRAKEEFDGGHIPGAVCIPNETIGEDAIAELPDKDQVILVYCRSGVRSKEASQKLSDMGYTNVYEFGGIVYWTGEIVIDDTISVTFVNEVKTADVWILPEIKKNLDTTVWGRATSAKQERGESRTLDVASVGEEGHHIVRVIDKDGMYYSVNGLTLSDGCALYFREGESPMEYYVEVVDADGETVGTYKMFAAAL